MRKKEKELIKNAMKISTEKNLMKYAGDCKKRGYNYSAAVIYAKAYEKFGTKEAYNNAAKYADWADKEGLIHSAEDITSRLGLRPSKTIDSVVMTLMLLSGIGVLYSLFSKEAVMASQGMQLLAPPFSNYWIYAFPLVLICGGIYFLWKRARRDLIPLSF